MTVKVSLSWENAVVEDADQQIEEHFSGGPNAWSKDLTVEVDGRGVVSHAGSAVLRLLADNTGLTGALSQALRRDGFTPTHDRGQVLVDTAVYIADGREPSPPRWSPPTRSPPMPDTPTPSRDATVTAHCRCCQRPIPAGRGRLYCSPHCRQVAYRRRHTTTVEPPPLPAARPRPDATIHTCPDCDTRTLGEQRCPDCNTFTRRLDLGGCRPCPHCDEPVTVDELLQRPLDNT